MTYNGETYEGDWYKNKRTGMGKMTFIDDEVYEGEFDENIMNGKGKMFFANGDIFHGHFSGGVRHGYGVLVRANGDSEAEEWRHGVKMNSIEISDEDTPLRRLLIPVVNSCLYAWQVVEETVVSYGDLLQNLIAN